MAWTAPIVVHPPSPGGGRRVTVRGETVGVARSDKDLVEFLRRAGLEDADMILDDPHLIEWRGAGPHEAYDAA
ncbi:MULTISPECIES: hypothetical protein [Streptomyces]|uniref:Uncharacterized protein n=1 Tax=Streptomyces chengmaiensis TaxID=3040919 RepID=A0ABT6HP75_9ACTN|nr:MULTISPECIES: hypothetical protein [Streptomyces]MDH2390136.1 hypothetical protein [Streptomyces chengmaiensis]WRQ78352.1 hypothetical protein I3F59_002535 [Streptomyces sp. MUM 178J]